MRFTGWSLGAALILGWGFTSGCVRQAAPHSAASVEMTGETDGSEDLDPALERLAQAHAHYGAGVIHEMNGESEAALEDYCEAARDDPHNDELILQVSRRCLQAKQSEKALELLKRAAEQPEPTAAVLARLGLVYAQLGRYDEAAVADRAAIRHAPKSLVGYQNLFLSCLQNKQPDAALKTLDEAAAQPGTSAEFLVGVAELYGHFVLEAPSQKEKVDAKALAVLKRALLLEPQDPALRMRLADGLNLVGAPEPAAKIYLGLLQKLPDLPFVRERIHAKLANIYLQGSDTKRAIEQIQAFVKEDPLNPQAYFFLGRLCYEDKQAPAAAEYFKKALLLRPGFEDAYYYLALAQLAMDATSDALATLDRARQRFAPSFQMELWTGLAYSRQKAWREALRHYTAAEVIAKSADPSKLTEQFYFEMGAAAERSGDLGQAEQCFQKCLQLAPRFAPAQNYLGYMWAERGVKLEQARQLIQRAVKEEPQNPAYLDSLGWVLFKLGQPRHALDYVLKAVSLSAQPDPTLFDHLGDIYAALKQRDKAREAWRKSLALEANDQVREKLDSIGAR